jgi:hypothetical protein
MSFGCCGRSSQRPDPFADTGTATNERASYIGTDHPDSRSRKDQARQKQDFNMPSNLLYLINPS